MIPKIIWQTHNYEFDQLPLYAKQAAMSWVNLNPGWDYIYHTHDERQQYVKDNYPELYKFYECSTPVRQSDIWRYLVVHDSGGVYADMDSFCIVPLDHMLKNVKVTADIVTTGLVKDIKITGQWINNSNFAAVKNSKVIKDMIRLMRERANVEGDDKDKKDLINEICTLAIFNQSTLFHPRLVAKNFIEYHSKDLKQDFSLDIMINYYGESTSYLEIVKNNNLKTH
jgi:hypothetical protein